MKKVLLVFALLAAVSAPVLAQSDDELSEFAQMLKEDLVATKKDLIKKGMITFTDEEAKRFWPIYDDYNAELGNFVDARLALIKAYADDYDTMTDDKAMELLNRRFNIEKQRAALDEKYRPKFATALSPRRLVRFYQIEHQLDLLIQLRTSAAIPKMKWW